MRWSDCHTCGTVEDHGRRCYDRVFPDRSAGVPPAVYAKLESPKEGGFAAVHCGEAAA